MGQAALSGTLQKQKAARGEGMLAGRRESLLGPLPATLALQNWQEMTGYTGFYFYFVVTFVIVVKKYQSF